IEALHLGKRELRLVGAGVLDDRLQLGIEALPRLERDDAFAGAVRLVEAGRIVEARHPVEPKRDVGAGADELRAIDQAELHADENLGWRSGLGKGAEAAIDLAAGAERADLEALHVVSAIDLAAKPATHAHAGIAAHERLDPERRVELVPQCLPAAGIDPGN